MRELQSCRVPGLQAGVLLVCLLLAAAAPARAQQPPPPQSPPQADPRWEAWLGCWEPVSGPAKVAGDTTSAPLVCVIPSPGSVGVDVATVAGGRIVSRERIEATGEHRSVTREGCSGWESAEFSTEGQRVFLTAEYTCPGNLKRTTNELMAVTPNGEWLDVRGAAVRGLPEGVRVLRYRPAGGSAPVPSDLAWALQGSAMAVTTAREAAGAPPESEDVVEAAHQLAPSVVEAWLVEEGEGFALDGRRLAQLRGAGVPDRVIDVMVALSYPGVFAINLATRSAERRAPEQGYGDRRPPMYALGYGSPFGCYSPFAWDCYSPYGWGYYSPYLSSPYGYYSPYGYWSGYGFYPSGGVVVVSGGGGQVARHGRMVIGKGYAPGAAGRTARPARARGASGPERSSSSQGKSSRSEGSGSSSGSSSSGSSSSGRRAVPKP
jgi:hypothetical protein